MLQELNTLIVAHKCFFSQAFLNAVSVFYSLEAAAGFGSVASSWRPHQRWRPSLEEEKRESESERRVHSATVEEELTEGRQGFK